MEIVLEKEIWYEEFWTCMHPGNNTIPRGLMQPLSKGFKKFAAHFQELLSLLHSIPSALSKLQSEIPAQLLHFGLWRSEFNEKLKFCLNIARVGPNYWHSAEFVDYCINLLHVYQMLYDGSSRYWSQEILVTGVVMEYREQRKKLSNNLNKIFKMILVSIFVLLPVDNNFLLRQ